MAYRLSEDAQRDLIDIYLAGEERFGSRQADRYADRFVRIFELLSAHPQLAHARPVLGGSRVHPVGVHIVVYRLEGEDVLVQRVRHGREDWQSEDERR